MALWISVILSEDSFGKVFLILILPLNAYTYNWLLELETELEDWFFLKNFDLAKMLLLDLRGIGKEILKIFVFW